MAISDYDKIQFSARIPKYHNTHNDQIDITVSGDVAASTTVTFTGTWSGTLSPGSLRGHLQQSPVPTDDFTLYTDTARLPLSCTDASAGPRQGCSVVGVPAAASIDVVVNVSRSPIGVEAKIVINNPYGGVMTLTSTTYTIKFWVYTPTYLL